MGPWLAEDPGISSLLLNNAIDRHKGIVLIDTPGHYPSAKTITTAKGFKPIGSTMRMYKGVMPKSHDATSMDRPGSSLAESEDQATTP